MLLHVRLTYLCVILCTIVSATQPAEGDDATCPAGAENCGGKGKAIIKGRQHFWPFARGRFGSYSSSPHTVPQNLAAKLAWTWEHPSGKYAVLNRAATLIDDQKNIYHTVGDGVRKLSPDGELLWTVLHETMHAATLYEDALFLFGADGFAISVDLGTGLKRWSTQIAEPGIEDTRAGERFDKPRGMGVGICSPGAHKGVLIGPAGRSVGPFMEFGSTHLVALNTTDGAILWNYHTDNQLWNFEPFFTEQDTFVFQDQIGGVFHMTLGGEMLWKAGYSGVWCETWTDGLIMLADDLVVATHSNTTPPASGDYRDAWDPRGGGDVSAYNLQDGKLLWRWQSPYPPNSQPLVAKLRQGGGLSVVMPIGLPMGPPGILSFPSTPFLPLSVNKLIHTLGMWLGDYQRFLWRNPTWPTSVVALDAKTGELQWQWSPPDWPRASSAGEDEGLVDRLPSKTGEIFCAPNPWASPSLDATGTIYLGHLNGKIYSIKDVNNDGSIDEAAGEVSSFTTGAAFPHPGPAIAPGMMAISNCETLYVFKE